MIERRYPLGKTPARPGAVSLKLATYIDTTALPTPPSVFGHESLIGASWSMLGNDQWGDCVWSGAAHETMLWNKEAGTSICFTDQTVLSDYSAVTGFNPSGPSTDQGTDMQVAASYRRKTGVLDATGKRHKVLAYLAIKPGNLKEHLLAAYLFGAVGIGIKFPNSAMKQFNAGQPWDYVKGSKISGGHYVVLVGRAVNGNLLVVTWGKIQEVTPKFFSHYNDESLAYLDTEMLTKGKSLEGLNLSQLKVDLAQVAKA